MPYERWMANHKPLIKGTKFLNYGCDYTGHLQRPRGGHGLLTMCPSKRANLASSLRLAPDHGKPQKERSKKILPFLDVFLWRAVGMAGGTIWVCSGPCTVATVLWTAVSSSRAVRACSATATCCSILIHPRKNHCGSSSSWAV